MGRRTTGRLELPRSVGVPDHFVLSAFGYLTRAFARRASSWADVPQAGANTRARPGSTDTRAGPREGSVPSASRIRALTGPEARSIS